MTDQQYHNPRVCPQNTEFVETVTNLASAVEIQANNVKWIEKGAKYVGALVLSIIALSIVGLFYAGAMYQQVQLNTLLIQENHIHIDEHTKEYDHGILQSKNNLTNKAPQP